MYYKHFRLKSPPFNITPDPQFFFDEDQYKEILAQMVNCVINRSGLVCLTGPVGSGKTTLAEAVKSFLPDGTVLVPISVPPNTNPRELTSFVGYCLGLKDMPPSPLIMYDMIRTELIKIADNGGRCVLVIDEAQFMNDDFLREVLFLSNIETGSNKLVQIFVLGQKELIDILNRPDMRQLKQRVAVSRHLKPMKGKQTVRYIHHRMKIVGSSASVFSRDALKFIAGCSGGIPRVINKLCDLSLQKAFLRNKKIVDLLDVREANEECGVNGLQIKRNEPSQENLNQDFDYASPSSRQKALTPASLSDEGETPLDFENPYDDDQADAQDSVEDEHDSAMDDNESELELSLDEDNFDSPATRRPLRKKVKKAANNKTRPDVSDQTPDPEDQTPDPDEQPLGYGAEPLVPDEQPQSNDEEPQGNDEEPMESDIDFYADIQAMQKTSQQDDPDSESNDKSSDSKSNGRPKPKAPTINDTPDPDEVLVTKLIQESPQGISIKNMLKKTGFDTLRLYKSLGRAEKRNEIKGLESGLYVGGNQVKNPVIEILAEISPKVPSTDSDAPDSANTSTNDFDMSSVYGSMNDPVASGKVASENDDSSDDASNEDVSSGDVSSEDISSEDVSNEDVSSDDVSSEDVSNEDVSSEDVSSEDVSSEDVSSDDVSSEDVSSEDVSSEDVSSKDVSNDDDLDDSEEISIDYDEITASELTGNGSEEEALESDFEAIIGMDWQSAVNEELEVESTRKVTSTVFEHTKKESTKKATPPVNEYTEEDYPGDSYLEEEPDSTPPPVPEDKKESTADDSIDNAAQQESDDDNSIDEIPVMPVFIDEGFECEGDKDVDSDASPADNLDTDKASSSQEHLQDEIDDIPVMPVFIDEGFDDEEEAEPDESTPPGKGKPEESDDIESSDPQEHLQEEDDDETEIDPFDDIAVMPVYIDEGFDDDDDEENDFKVQEDILEFDNYSGLDDKSKLGKAIILLVLAVLGVAFWFLYLKPSGVFNTSQNKPKPAPRSVTLKIEVPEKASTPVVNEPAPVEGEAAPVEEKAASAEDKTAPVDDKAVPAEKSVADGQAGDKIEEPVPEPWPPAVLPSPGSGRERVDSPPQAQPVQTAKDAPEASTADDSPVPGEEEPLKTSEAPESAAKEPPPVPEKPDNKNPEVIEPPWVNNKPGKAIKKSTKKATDRRASASSDFNVATWGKSYPFSMLVKTATTKEAAIKRANEISIKTGLQMYWVRVNLRGMGMRYRVLTGNFESKEDALAFIKKLNIGVGSPIRTTYAAWLGTYKTSEIAKIKMGGIEHNGFSPYLIQGTDGRYYIFAGAYSTKGEAEFLCSRLFKIGIDCRAVKR